MARRQFARAPACFPLAFNHNLELFPPTHPKPEIHIRLLMKTINRYAPHALGAMALSLLCATAHAQSLGSVGLKMGLNNAGGILPLSTAGSLKPTDLAGATIANGGYQAAQTNWNNCARYSGPVNPIDQYSNKTVLYISWDSPNVYGGVGGNTTSGGTAYTNQPDNQLMNAYIDSNNTANEIADDGVVAGVSIYENNGLIANGNFDKPWMWVSNLVAWMAQESACSYDVVVYTSGDTAGRGGRYWIQAASGAATSFTTGRDLTGEIYVKAPTPFVNLPNYVQVPPTANTQAGAATGNFVVFPGLTADCILIRESEWNTRAPINAIQLIPHVSATPFFNYPLPTTPQTNYGGSSTTFFMPASGCALSYQWMAGAIGSGIYTNLVDGGNLYGSTTARLVITNLFPANSADYVLVATNTSGSVQSSPITMDVPAQIITGPFTNEVLYPAMTAHFVTTVSLTGNNNVYTWYKGATALTDGATGTGSTISGSASTNLTVGPVSAADVGTYWMTVSNVYGMTTSAVSTLSLLAAPTPGTFAEAVVTNAPLAYWRFNETDLSLMAYDNAGGLNGTYGSAVSVNQPGSGYAGWTNDTPTDLSFYAPNAVNGWVTIPPLNLNTNTVTIVAWVNLTANQNNWAGILTSRHNGTAAGFNFSGLQPNELSYTWDENTAATYNNNFGVYVTNNVWTMVALVVTPTNATVYACDPVGGIRSSAYGYGNNQELFYGPGTIGNDDTFTGRQMNGYINDVAVFSHALSPTAVTWLYVAGSSADAVPAPTIVQQPLSQELYVGRPAVLSVVPAGLPPFSYQWLSNGVPMVNGGRISGATNATLIIANAQAGDAADYSVTVANNGGPVTSAAASLSLVTPTGAAYEAAVIASGPYAYWRLNEAQNSTYAWDFYGGYTATYGSAASGGAGSVPGPVSPDWPGLEAANVALPCYWEVAGDTLAVPPLNLNTNAVTIAAWINPHSEQTTNYVGLVFSRQNLTAAGLSYGAISNHLGCSWNGNVTAADYAWDPGFVVPDGQWSFAAVVFEPTRSTLYLYNTSNLLAAAHTVVHTNQAFDGLTYLGMDPIYANGARQFNGDIDEVTIWNRALTGPQIAALYTAASGVTVPPSVALQPVPTTLYVGKTNSLTAVGAGTGPLTYQWYVNNLVVTNGGDILGATTTTLSFTNAALTDAGNYACVVTSSLGSATSTVVALTVLPASASPVFTVSANNAATFVNLTNQAGIVVGCEDFGATEYSFNVTNSGVVTTYDFKADGSVATATGNGQTTGALTGTGTFGFTSGNTNFDNVLNEFSYDGGPKTITVKGLIPGRQYTLQIYSLDDRDSSGGQHREQTRRGYFQDPYNLTNVSGTFYMSNNIYVKATFTAASTNQVLIMQLPGWPNTAATDTGDGGLEALVIRDTGTTPVIQYAPASITRYPAKAATFSASFYGPAPMGYQWQRNTGGGFSNLPYAGTITQPNATTVSITNPAVAFTDAGSYRLIVTNSAGAATSQVATLTVISPAAGSYEAAVLSYGPLAYWACDEPAGVTVAHDYVGGFDGVYQPTCTNGVPGVPPYFTGFTAGDLAFESVYGYTNSGVIIPALNFPATNTITWTAWIAPSSTTNGVSGFPQQAWTGIVMTRASTYASGMGYNNTGLLGYTWNQNNGNTYGFVSGLTIPSDQWSFVAVAISATNAALYLINTNGVQMTNNPIAHDVETWNGAGALGYDPIGGATPFARNFNGTVDDVAIFTSTLDPVAIVNLYGAVALTPPTPPAGLTATLSGLQVVLSWSAAPTATSYKVKRALTSGGPYTTLTSDLAALSFTDTNTTAGATYYYVVSASNTAGEGANSAEVPAQPVAATYPPLTYGMVGGMFQISWPADHLGWLLQSQTNTLSVGLSTNWVTIPGSGATNVFRFSNDGNSDAVFFRAIHP